MIQKKIKEKIVFHVLFFSAFKKGKKKIDKCWSAFSLVVEWYTSNVPAWVRFP